ncbi:MAG: hypothetical protein LBD02_07465 [Christensenellaceae bacterium]|jgi:hypothetical protein|nr:hypothetical protein [Christensenellaceae bacterium]
MESTKKSTLKARPRCSTSFAARAAGSIPARASPTKSFGYSKDGKDRVIADLDADKAYDECPIFFDMRMRAGYSTHYNSASAEILLFSLDGEKDLLRLLMNIPFDCYSVRILGGPILCRTGKGEEASFPFLQP